jgi:hypothetical protein
VTIAGHVFTGLHTGSFFAYILVIPPFYLSDINSILFENCTELSGSSFLTETSKGKEIWKQKFRAAVIHPGTSPNSPSRMASNPAATDSTANLFTSAPFDRDSNSKAPPASWCSIYRRAVIRSRAAAMTRKRANPYLHEDEAGEAGSSVGDPLVPCNGARDSRMFSGLG